MASPVGEPEDILLYYEGKSELNPPRPFRTDKVLYQHAGDGVYLITLNDPKRLNPMSLDMSRQMNLVVEHARRDENCKVLVWTGAGRAFSSGGQFSDTSTSVPDEVYEGYVHAGVSLAEPDISAAGVTRNMIKLQKISISAINGLAVGGGVNMAFTWQDFCFATQDATFQLPFADLGLTPELGSSAIISRQIGLSRAKMLLQLSKKITAAEAQAWGLVVEVLPSPAETLERALAEARRLAKLPQFALRENKRLVNADLVSSIDQITEDEYHTLRKAFKSPDTQKAMMKLMQKTKPKSKL